MSRIGAAPRAAVPVSNARAEASRKNGAKSRGPKTPEGKARSAQNALRHRLRAEKDVVLPEEDADEFAELEAAMIEELAPAGALQIVLARRGAGRRLASGAGGLLGRRTGLGLRRLTERGWGPVPQRVRRRPTPAAKRSSCPPSAASRTAASGSP
jgi:hypothetical protein